MYRGVNTALITTITWVILRIVMEQVVCATEATHIIGQHNPHVFAVAGHGKYLHTNSLPPLPSLISISPSSSLSLMSPSDPSFFLFYLMPQCNSLLWMLLQVTST